MLSYRTRKVFKKFILFKIIRFSPRTQHAVIEFIIKDTLTFQEE